MDVPTAIRMPLRIMPHRAVQPEDPGPQSRPYPPPQAWKDYVAGTATAAALCMYTQATIFLLAQLLFRNFRENVSAARKISTLMLKLIARRTWLSTLNYFFETKNTTMFPVSPVISGVALSLAFFILTYMPLLKTPAMFSAL